MDENFDDDQYDEDMIDSSINYNEEKFGNHNIMSEGDSQNLQDIEQQNKPIGFVGILFFLAFISVIIGLARGCTSELLGGSFRKEFLDQTGWIFSIIIIVAIFLIIAFIGGIFGGKNTNNKY